MSPAATSDRLRPSPPRPSEWLWMVGVVRVVMLAVIASGAYFVADLAGSYAGYLLAVFFAFGLISAFWYLFAVRSPKPVPVLLTWAQVLVDFGVVAATVSFTGGPASFFTFLFVVVILEAGLLLGLAQGFVFASLATGVMLVLVLISEPAAGAAQGSDEEHRLAMLTLWYSFSVQGLAYYLTAAISGYWNQRVRRMMQFQHEVLDNMNNGFLIVNRNGVVTSLNKAGNRILGYEEGDAVGRSVEEVLRVAGGGECPVLAALRSEKDFTRYEFHALTTSDKVRLLGLSTSRAYDWRGDLLHVIASFSDLTELDEMRQELHRQDRLAVVGELAAGLAHEIRNPVAAIRGAVDELRGCADSPELRERLAAIALRESDHLNQIVTDFLDFARDPQVRRELFDVRELVREVGQWLDRKYAEHEELSVELKEPGEPCMVSGDPHQLRQIFTNLGKNAVEANGGRGAVSIEVAQDANTVEIRFDDEGPGINPDEVARVFEPFYTTKKGGVGMGLAVCQRLVTAHDGVIRPTLREGGGMSMAVRLPTTQVEE